MKKLSVLLMLFPLILFARGRAYLAYDGTFANEYIETSHMLTEEYAHIAAHFVYEGSGISADCWLEGSNNKINWVQVEGSQFALQSSSNTDIVNKSNFILKWLRARCLSQTVNPTAMKIWLSGKN